MVSLLAELAKTNEAGILGLSVGADEKNSVKNIASFYQSGLSLPEKDYYFKTDSASKSGPEQVLLIMLKHYSSFQVLILHWPQKMQILF